MLALPIIVALGSLACIFPGDPELSLIAHINKHWHHVIQPFNIQPIAGWSPLPILLAYLIALGTYELFYIPLSILGEYGFKRYYRLPTYHLRTYLRRCLNSQGRLIIKWMLLTEVLYLFSAWMEGSWWIAMGAFQCLLDIVWELLHPFLLARQYRLQSLTDTTLRQRLQQFMAQYKTHISRIVILERPGARLVPNAFVAGWGPTSSICIVHTMLERFSTDEIQVVVAHELGHHKHGDFWQLVFLKNALRSLCYWVLSFGLLYVTTIPMYGFRGPTDSSTVPFILCFLVLIWLGITLVLQKVSQHMEYQADRFALRTTGLTTAFKHAMLRLTTTNEILTHKQMYSDHPSIASRLQRADAFMAGTDNQAQPLSAKDTSRTAF